MPQNRRLPTRPIDDLDVPLPRYCDLVPQQPSAAANATAVKGGSAIAVAIGVMNISTYAFTIFAARAMGPQEFGGFAALMNVLMVCGVLALAMQATAARRIAREPEHLHAVRREILTVGTRASAGAGLLLVALSPLINQVLRLESIGAAILLAIAVVPTTMLGAQVGVLQGQRHWIPLAVVYLTAGLPRVIIGGALMLWRPDVVVAISAVALGAFVPVLVAAIALKRIGPGSDDAPDDPADRVDPVDTVGPVHPGDHSARHLWWETVHNSQALLAFLVLSSADIILARNALDLHDAGLYAGGLIMVKAVTFLPQFVVVLAFPSMGTEATGRRALVISLTLVALTGLAVTVGVQILPDLALIFVGGDDFTEIRSRLWLFAILGTVVSMLQLLVYSVLAQQARRSVILLWASLIPLVIAGLTSDSVLQLLVRVLIVDSLLLLVLLTLGLRRLRPARVREERPEAPAR